MGQYHGLDDKINQPLATDKFGYGTPAQSTPAQSIRQARSKYPDMLAPGKAPFEKVPGGQRIARLSNYTPQQMELFQQMFGQVEPDSYTARLAGGDESMFEQMEAPAWRQLQQAQGNTASRFSGMGMGARRGSGFQNENSQQDLDFAMGLQSQRQSLQRQAIQDLMGMSQTLLNDKPYEQFMYEKRNNKQGGWSGALSGAATGASAGAAFGPWGALAGGVAGGAIGYFSKGQQQQGGGGGGGGGNPFGMMGGMMGGGGGGQQNLSSGGQPMVRQIYSS